MGCYLPHALQTLISGLQLASQSVDTEGFSAYQAYKVRGYATVPNPKVLLTEYWTSPAFDTKARLAATMAEVIEENERLTDSKARWVRVAMRSLLSEAAMLLLLLVLQVAV